MPIALLNLPTGNISISDAAAVIAAIIGVGNLIMNLTIKNSILTASKETREWVNGSFMRNSVVEAQMDSVEVRQKALEDKFDGWDKRLSYLQEHGCARLLTHIGTTDKS